MPTVIATPTADMNSFASELDFDDYCSTRLALPTQAATVSDENKQKALITATRLLVERCEWEGDKTNSEWLMPWPRFGVLDREGNIYFDMYQIPKFLINATCELAIQLLIVPDARLGEPTRGIAAIGGVISITFDKADRRAVIPDVVWDMLWPYASNGPSPRVSGGRTLRSIVIDRDYY